MAVAIHMLEQTPMSAAARHAMESESAVRPLDGLWEARTIIWVVLAGEALAVALTLAPGREGPRLVYFGMASFAIQWIALVAMGLLYLTRKQLAQRTPVQVATVALASLMVSTWLVSILAWSFLGDIWRGPAGGWFMLSLQLSAVSMTLGMLALAAFRAHWRTRQIALRAKQAELEALQARVHPHFLFNSLNTALALVHQRPDDAERVLMDLSDLFRSALAGPRHIPLSEELELARRYLEIEELRLGERLEVDWDLPATMPVLEVPALSVQPLVENAVRHGIERRPQGGRIEVVLVHGADRVKLTVRNDLPAQPAPAGGNGHGVGQPSVASRIEAMTGGRGSLVTSVEEGRYVATLTLPLET